MFPVNERYIHIITLPPQYLNKAYIVTVKVFYSVSTTNLHFYLSMITSGNSFTDPSGTGKGRGKRKKRGWGREGRGRDTCTFEKQITTASPI